MEFIPYNDALETLAGVGVHVEETDQHARFVLRTDGSSAMPTGEVQHIVLGPAVSDAEGGARSVTMSADRMGEAVESLVHTAHLAEAVVIPVARWRDVLDLVAFSLAEEDDWADVDAEAALHQNSRDPLGLHQRQRHVLGMLVDALLENGSASHHEVTIAALDAPILIEIRHDGPVRVSCIGTDVASSLIESLKILS